MLYREIGAGPPIVLVHQILRTSLDYRAVMHALAVRHRVVAFDNVGCGDSDPAPFPYSLDDHARALGIAAERLGLRDVVLAGHHSGANIALELGLQRPELVRAVVLSGLFYVEDLEQRADLLAKARALRDPEPTADGSHLLTLWQEGVRTNWGKPRFPTHRIDLIGEFFLEQYRTGPRRFEPYVAQMQYDTAARLPALRRPCHFVSASDDVWMCSAVDLWRRDQPDASVTRIEGTQGGELPRLCPSEWAAAIDRFVDAVPTRANPA